MDENEKGGREGGITWNLWVVRFNVKLARYVKVLNSMWRVAQEVQIEKTSYNCQWSLHLASMQTQK